MAALLFQPAAGTAFAHAEITQSSIAPRSLLPSLPATLTLTFSENIIASQSSLSVTGPDGVAAVAGSPRQGASARVLTTRLSTRGGGTYRVYWSSVSAEDGHVVSGGFAFAVGHVSAPGDLQQAVGARHSTTLRLVTFLSTLVRWLLLILAIGWAGGALLEGSLSASSSKAAISGDDGWIGVVADYAHTLRSRVLEALLALLALSWLLTAAEIWTAGRVSATGAIAGLFSGHLGLARVAEVVVLVAALFAERANTGEATSRAAQRGIAVGRSAAARGSQHAPLSPGLLRGIQVIAATLFLLILASTTHAAGVPGITLSAVVISWFHDLGAAAWIGGVWYVVIAALPVLDDADLDRRTPLLLGLLRRYTTLARAGIVVLLATGLFAMQVQVGSRGDLTGNAYGNTLVLKMLLVLVALVLTIAVLGGQRRSVERVWASRQRLDSLAVIDNLGRMLRITAVAGVLVMGSTAALWSDAPPTASQQELRAAPARPLSAASWQSVGLRGRVVHRLLFQPGNRHVLWAATDAGVWRSVDDQRTWQQAGTALKKIDIRDLLALGGGHGLLAASADGHLYRTYDQGKHWEALIRPFGIHPLRVLAQHGKVMVAAGDDGIFRSTDYSNHWHLVLKPAQGIATVYWSPADQRFLAGVERGTWRTYSAAADGATWHEVAGTPGAQGPVAALAVFPSAIPRLVAGAGTGVYVASSASGPWTQAGGIAAGAAVASLLPDNRALGRMYLGTIGGGAYGTVDGGTSWSPLGAHTPSTIYNLVMRPGPTEIVYAATSTGAYRLKL